MAVELSRETRERGKAQVAALRKRLRDAGNDDVTAEPDDDLETEDAEPIDHWRERKDLQ